MAIHPLAGQPAPASSLIDVGRLERAYHENRPDLADPFQLVAFGTSGRRGTPLQGTIAEAHILVIFQAICDDRHRHDTDGKMLFHNGLIDRVVRKLGRQLSEVPVGFKWFTSELFDGSCRFGGEESAGTSHLRDDFRAPAVGVGSLLEAAIMLARMRGDRGCRLERSIPDPLAS